MTDFAYPRDLPPKGRKWGHGRAKVFVRWVTGLLAVMLPAWSLGSPLVQPGELDWLSVGAVGLVAGALLAWSRQLGWQRVLIYLGLLGLATAAADRASPGFLTWWHMRGEATPCDLSHPPDWSRVHGKVSVLAKVQNQPILDEYSVPSGKRPDQDDAAGTVIARLLPVGQSAPLHSPIVLARLAAAQPRSGGEQTIEGWLTPADLRLAIALAAGDDESATNDANAKTSMPAQAWMIDTLAGPPSTMRVLLGAAALCAVLAVALVVWVVPAKGAAQTP